MNQDVVAATSKFTRQYSQYDLDNRILELAVENSEGDTRKEFYSYDTRGFLKESIQTTLDNGKDNHLVFEYDEAGNHLRNRSGKLHFQSSSAGSSIEDSLNQITWKFDSLGRAQSIPGIKQLHWASEDRLACLIEDNGNRTHLEFLPDGSRFSEVLRSGGKTQSRVFISKFAEFAKETSKLRKYHFFGGQRIAFEEDGQVYYLFHDHLSSPVAEVGPGVHRQSEWRFPFGELASTTGEKKGRYGFAGALETSSLPILQMGKRFYDPRLGRFISADGFFLEQPWECARSWVECNLYTYAKNDPINYSDPTGSLAETVLDVASIGMGIYSISQWDDKTTFWSKAADIAGLGVDTVAAAVPFVPGGAGILIKGMKAPSPVDTLKVLDHTKFPSDPNDLTKILGVEPKVSNTVDGTLRMKWEPNANTRIRYESHPGDLRPDRSNFNPRHHSQHYHVETKSSGEGWKQKVKIQPENYTPSMGTGFLPGEKFPGK